jgi:hypothetical protein
MANGNDNPSFRRDLIWEKTAEGKWQVRWDAYQSLAIIVGVLILLIFVPLTFSWKSLGGSLLIAAVALAAGLLFGFLFGIPKAVQDQTQPVTTPGQPPDKAKKSQAKAKLKANTNLVEISDWLTKMIVGVGLYQLSTLPPKLKALAGYFATAFTPPGPGPALVMAILGYFAIFGFLLGYLWARIYLTKEFEEADGDDSESSPPARQQRAQQQQGQQQGSVTP